MHLGEEFYTQTQLEESGFRRIGSNVKIKRNAGLFFTENISIGNNVRIDDFTIIVASRDPVIIGDHVHISAHGYISGSDGFVIEDFSTLAPGVLIFSSSDDYTGTKMTNVTIPKRYRGGPSGPVHFGRHTIIGAGTVVFPNVTLGDGVAVGAQSLVTRSLLPWGIYCGIPVRLLRPRNKDIVNLEREFGLNATERPA